MKSVEWKTYRTRFLVKAKQLSSTLSFTDHLGRQHCGRKGDYLVESCDGVLSIAPRQIFEDIYVPMAASDSSDAALSDPLPSELQSISDSMNDLRVESLKIEKMKLENMKIENVKFEKIKPTSSLQPEAQRGDPERPPRSTRKSPQSVRATSPRLSLM